jgi:hypothetical protein
MVLINVGVYVTKRVSVHIKAELLREMTQSGRDLSIALIGRDCLLELAWKINH